MKIKIHAAIDGVAMGPREIPRVQSEAALRNQFKGAKKVQVLDPDTGEQKKVNQISDGDVVVVSTK